jgi:8-oxo-dGTP pyrophosphatase MutT (NUDIX family)
MKNSSCRAVPLLVDRIGPNGQVNNCGDATSLTGRKDERKNQRYVFSTLLFRTVSRGPPRLKFLVTTRQTKRWIIPKGWPIKGLSPAKSAAREAFEEAGVRGKIGAKSVGLFTYDKLLDGDGVTVACEVKVFPLLVTRQSETWPEFEQRLIQWVDPAKATALVKEQGLKVLITAFAKRLAAKAAKSLS